MSIGFLDPVSWRKNKWGIIRKITIKGIIKCKRRKVRRSDLM
jgi:hypothetical protein